MAFRQHLGRYLRITAPFERGRRPLAISLSLLIILTSVSFGAEEPTEDVVGALIERGPHAVLDVNPQGKIVPKPQASRTAIEFATSVATSLTVAKENGFFEVAESFAVTLTPKGRDFALGMVERNSAGCDRVKSISADWLGIHLDLEQTCTQEELAERLGIDLEEVEQAEQAAAVAPISAAGLAPAPAPRSAGNAVTSDLFGCLLSASTFALGGALAAVAWAVASPVTLWILFWIRWSGALSTLVAAATNWVQNCTQVLRTEAQVRRWVAYEPLALPIAVAGIGNLRVGRPVSPSDAPDATWVYMYVRCSFGFYSNYRSSSNGAYVPTYIRYNC